MDDLPRSGSHSMRRAFAFRAGKRIFVVPR
jgi:hypothetical protein